MAEPATNVAATPPPNGAANQPWFSGYDDDSKGFVTAKGWDKLDAGAALAQAVKGYRGAESMLGVPADQVLKLPGANAKPEDWRPIWAKLGAPEKPDDYGLPVPDGADPTFAKTAAAWFHEHGVPKAAAVAIASKWNEHIAGSEAAQLDAWNKRFDEEMNALKSDWKGDDFAKNSDLAKRVMKHTGWTSEQLTAMERALGPRAFLQGFAKFGGMVGEHRFVGDAGSTQFAQSPEAAKARIDALMKDGAWQEARGKGDADKQAEWTKLHEIAYGTEPANAGSGFVGFT